MDIKNMMEHRNVLSDEAVHYIEGYLIYLRKSRQDDPNETVEEVLSKHETRLQELAMRELGGLIPEENIYREVASGEKIDEREEIQKVLSRIEDDDVKGVLVVEPSRLSRGDLGDCDRIIKSFLYTDTLVVTPEMTYDLKNKMARKFFQQKLLMSNEFLEYTKEILWSGRVASAKRGNYLPAHPPFGYSKARIGKDVTLEPNAEADVVRMIFEWYAGDGLSLGEIAQRLTDMGIQTRKGGSWERTVIRTMLSNPIYIGKIRYNQRKATPSLEYGERKIKWVKQPEEEVILVEGKHPAIVSTELFEAAQARIKSNPHFRTTYGLQNVLAGVLRCKKCGKMMDRTIRYNRSEEVARYNCHSRPGCYKSARAQEVINEVIFALEESELPNLQLKLESGEGNAVVIQKRHIEKLSKQMSELRDRKERLYEFLETGVYTREDFMQRSKALQEKMESLEKEMHLARQAIPKSINYEERINALKDAIAALKDPDMTTEQKNRILRFIVERIDYSATDLGFGETGVHLDVYLKLM